MSVRALYRVALTRFVPRRVSDEADVADIVQESFSRLLRYGDQEDIGALKGILFRIAGNLILLRASIDAGPAVGRGYPPVGRTAVAGA